MLPSLLQRSYISGCFDGPTIYLLSDCLPTEASNFPSFVYHPPLLPHFSAVFLHPFFVHLILLSTTFLRIFFFIPIFSLNFFIFLLSLRFTLYILRTRWFLLTITCPGSLSVPVYLTPTHTLVKHRLSTLFRLFVFSFLSAFCPT